jgi:hypothetical protein
MFVKIIGFDWDNPPWGVEFQDPYKGTVLQEKAKKNSRNWANTQMELDHGCTTWKDKAGTKRHYTSEGLKSLIYSEGHDKFLHLDYKVKVGGVGVSIVDLIQAGWTCKITESLWGGRTKVMFSCPQRKSNISFKLGPKAAMMSIPGILRNLYEESGILNMSTNAEREKILKALHKTLKALHKTQTENFELKKKFSQYEESKGKPEVVTVKTCDVDPLTVLAMMDDQEILEELNRRIRARLPQKRIKKVPSEFVEAMAGAA